eukprot:7709837-Pyramimonas_sp.AAC.1
MVRRVCIEATTQATAAARTNCALRTNSNTTGHHYYDEGDSVDDHRPTTTEDDWGGSNGPFPVARNDPDRGQVVTRVEHRDVQVQRGDARRSLYIEALVARERGSDIAALRTVMTFIASLLAGRPAKTFGCTLAKGERVR